MEGTKTKKGYANTLRCPYGVTLPVAPLVGSLFFRTDELKIYIFLGIGEPGTTAGWFNLKSAQYS